MSQQQIVWPETKLTVILSKYQKLNCSDGRRADSQITETKFGAKLGGLLTLRQTCGKGIPQRGQTPGFEVELTPDFV